MMKNAEKYRKYRKNRKNRKNRSDSILRLRFPFKNQGALQAHT